MPAPTTHLKDVLPLVSPSVRTCPQMVQTLHLRQAAIEFCERTRCWRHVASQRLVANDAVLVTPPYATIHAIETAEIDGTPLVPIAYSDIGANDLLIEGSPAYVTQVQDDRLTVVPFAEGTLTLSLFLKPRQGRAFVSDGLTAEDSLDRIPTFLYRQYAHVLAKGALASLLLLPDCEWTDPALAAQNRAEFLDRCAAGTVQSLKGRQRAPLRSKVGWV